MQGRMRCEASAGFQAAALRSGMLEQHAYDAFYPETAPLWFLTDCLLQLDDSGDVPELAKRLTQLSSGAAADSTTSWQA